MLLQPCDLFREQGAHFTSPSTHEHLQGAQPNVSMCSAISSSSATVAARGSAAPAVGPKGWPRRASAKASAPAHSIRRSRGSASGIPGASGQHAPETGNTHSAPDHPGARLALGSALGALAAASGVALTATAGWLIARAAEHPPVLMLMVAIVGVRTFGLARPALRYAERLVSHDVALRLLAERRARVYDALVPLVPGRIGRQRGDVLASIVDDVDSLVDRYLRVRAPLVTYSAVATIATLLAAWVLPSAGVVTGLTLIVGGGLAYSVRRFGVARAERQFVAGRAAVSTAVVHTLHGAADLIMWQAEQRALAGVDEAGEAASRAASRSAAAVATARALAVGTAGLGVLAVAWVGGPALAEQIADEVRQDCAEAAVHEVAVGEPVPEAARQRELRKRGEQPGAKPGEQRGTGPPLGAHRRAYYP